MIQRTHFVAQAITLAVLVALSGCGFRSAAVIIPTLSNVPPGPHGGDWIDMGGEELFAEFVHGKSGKLTVYLFDEMKKTAPADQPELKLTLSGPDGPREFNLKPAKREDLSVFVSTDQELLNAFEHEKITAAHMSVIALGKEYALEFNHDPHGEATNDKAPASDKKP